MKTLSDYHQDFELKEGAIILLEPSNDEPYEWQLLQSSTVFLYVKWIHAAIQPEKEMDATSGLFCKGSHILAVYEL